MSQEIKRYITRTVTVDAESKSVHDLLRAVQRLFQVVPETAEVWVNRDVTIDGFHAKGLNRLTASWTEEES